MGFKVCDRVRSLISDGDGLRNGELGSVIEINRRGIPIVRWDEFNPVRHSAEDRTEYGHGWFIFRCDVVELAEEVDDLGDLPGANTDAKDILFDL